MSIKIENPVTSVLKSKVRLWIEYVMIAAIIVLAVTVSIMWWRGKALRAEMGSMDAVIASLNEANKTQQEALSTLRSIRELDSEVLSGLVADFNTIKNRDSATARRLAALERSNEVVRTYLDTAVPDELACVLDQTCDQDGDGIPDPTQGNAPEVR